MCKKMFDVIQMQTKWTIAAMAILLVMLPVHAATIGLSLSYNSVSNTLTVSELPLANTILAAGNTMILNYTSMTISGVRLSNSINTSSSIGISTVTAAQPKLNAAYACVNGQHQIVNAQYNFTISCPAAVNATRAVNSSTSNQIVSVTPEPNVTLSVSVRGIGSQTVDVGVGEKNVTVNNVRIVAPPTVSNVISLNSSYTQQNGSVTPEPNVTFAWRVSPMQKLNRNVTLAYNGIFANSTLNLTVRSKPEAICALRRNLTYAYNGVVSYVNDTAPCNVSISAGVVPWSANTIHLGPRQLLSIPGVANIVGANFTDLFHNNSEELMLWNSTAANDCAQGAMITIGAGTSNAMDLCTQLRNESPSIFTLLGSYDFASGNFSQSAAQAMLKSYAAANQSAVSCRMNLNYTNSRVAVLEGQLRNDSAQINSSETGFSVAFLIVGVIGVIVSVAIVILWRAQAAAKNAVRTKHGVGGRDEQV